MSSNLLENHVPVYTFAHSLYKELYFFVQYRNPFSQLYMRICFL